MKFISDYDIEGVNRAKISDIIKFLDSTREFVLDIETSSKVKKLDYGGEVYRPGLDPWLSKIIMVQIGNDKEQFVIDVRRVDIEFLLPYLVNPEYRIIIHNAQFESIHFLHNYGIKINNIWDTMIVEKLLYNGLPLSYSLEAVGKRRLGLKSIEDSSLFEEEIYEEDEEELDYLFNLLDGIHNKVIDKSTRLQFVNIGDKPFDAKQVNYGADDVTIPFKIYKQQLEGREINGEHWYPEEAIKLENKTTFVLAEMKYRGVPINQELWLDTEKKNAETFKVRKKAIDNFIINNYKQFTASIDLFTNEPTCAVDWASPTQVVKLFRFWDICPKEKSKQTGRLEWSVGAKALFKVLRKDLKECFLKDQFPPEIIGLEEFILAYLLYKKTEQLITSFGKSWLESYIHPVTKRVHANYNQLMISTRLSSNSCNIQQIPRTEDYRRCIAPNEGKLICNDYSQQEIYVAAFTHNSKELIKFLKEGDPTYGTDSHSFMAAKTFSIVYGKDFYCDKKSEERQYQKVISFQTIN